VEKLAKNAFDLDDVLSTASDLKYLGEVRRLVEEQLATPEEEFVRFFFSRVLPNSRFMPAAKEQFTVLVRQAFNDLISDKVSQRLRSALEHEDESREQSDAPDEQRSGVETDDGVETTEDELEGFRTVRAIVCNVVPVDRVVMRDSKSYCAILLDDNNRKPICRLHFNRTQKYVGLLDDEKKETRHAIERIEDLYSHADALRAAATRYAADT
jgi:hypothetical protein